MGFRFYYNFNSGWSKIFDHSAKLLYVVKGSMHEVRSVSTFDSADFVKNHPEIMKKVSSINRQYSKVDQLRVLMFKQVTIDTKMWRFP